jgi:DNA-binding MarR family transcriptional regulator
MLSKGRIMNKKQAVSKKTVNEIEFFLREISKIMRRKGRDILADFPITPPQFSALFSLYQFGEMTIGELSNRMFIACSTMTDLVDRMEKSNLVARIRDERDRRVVRIQLLEYGQKIIQEVLVARQAYLSRVLATFSQEQASQAEELLRALYKQMMTTD